MMNSNKKSEIILLLSNNPILPQGTIDDLTDNFDSYTEEEKDKIYSLLLKDEEYRANVLVDNANDIKQLTMDIKKENDDILTEFKILINKAETENLEDKTE